jgi:acyl-CoA reductase-like NAD-dependent aldehyde dehydrogenase
MLLATNLPFGGIKPSNIGREFSRGAVEAFIELKSAYIAD